MAEQPGGGDADKSGVAPLIKPSNPKGSKFENELISWTNRRSSFGACLVVVSLIVTALSVFWAHRSITEQSKAHREAIQGLLEHADVWHSNGVETAVQVESSTFLEALIAHGLVTTGSLSICWMLIAMAERLSKPLYLSEGGTEDSGSGPVGPAIDTMGKLIQQIMPLVKAVRGKD